MGNDEDEDKTNSKRTEMGIAIATLIISILVFVFVLVGLKKASSQTPNQPSTVACIQCVSASEVAKNDE